MRSEVITVLTLFVTAVSYSPDYFALAARGAKIKSTATVQKLRVIKSCSECLDSVVLDRKSELDRGFSFAVILNVNSYLSIDEYHVDSKLLMDFCYWHMKVIAVDSHHSASTCLFPQGLELPY